VLQAGLAGVPAVAKVPGLDEEAERLLALADRLTQALENAGLAPTLHVINVSGRQRMLAQRLAKLALLQPAGPALSVRDPLPRIWRRRPRRSSMGWPT